LNFGGVNFVQSFVQHLGPRFQFTFWRKRIDRFGAGKGLRFGRVQFPKTIRDLAFLRPSIEIEVAIVQVALVLAAEQPF